MSDHDIFSLQSEINELDFKVRKLEQQLGSCDIVKLEKNIESVSIVMNQVLAWKKIKDGRVK